MIYVTAEPFTNNYAFQVLVDMVRVPDWAFETAAGQEMRGMAQDTASYHPGLYLTETQVHLTTLYKLVSLNSLLKMVNHKDRLCNLLIPESRLERSSGGPHSRTPKVHAKSCSN